MDDGKSRARADGHKPDERKMNGFFDRTRIFLTDEEAVFLPTTVYGPSRPQAILLVEIFFDGRRSGFFTYHNSVHRELSFTL
jgi:hypothetical protein